MRKHGIKLLDSLLGTVQIDWIIVSSDECRDNASEDKFVRTHFRKPHEPWGNHGAFVMPVDIRRSRRRILFMQESGIK
jgi:hypothetical protein